MNEAFNNKFLQVKKNLSDINDMLNDKVDTVIKRSDNELEALRQNQIEESDKIYEKLEALEHKIDNNFRYFTLFKELDFKQRNQ